MTQKKKKKAPANPARGFATTSLPSKPKVVDSANVAAQAPENADKETSSESVSNDVSVQAKKVSSAEASGSKGLAEMTADELEEHFEHERLQLLIEQNAVRVKADASRAVSKLRVERRQLRSNAEKLAAASWLNEELVELILTTPSTTTPPHFRSDVTTRQADFDTDLLLQLWTIDRILDALKLPHVGEALEHLVFLQQSNRLQKTIDYPSGLLELLEWYAFKDGSASLPEYDAADDRSIEEYEPELELGKENTLALTENQTPPGFERVTSHDSLNSATETQDEPVLEFSESIPISDDEDNPAAFKSTYLSLRRALLEIEQLDQNVIQIHKHQVARRKGAIDAKLHTLRNDPLFDVDSAEAEWTLSKRYLVIEQEKAKKQLQRQQLKSNDNTTGNSQGEMTDASDEEDLLGEMFGTLEDDETRNGEANSTVHVHDYGTWNGLQPARLLQETVRHQLGSKGIRTTTLSQTPNSARRRMEIFWAVAAPLDELARESLLEGTNVKVSHRCWTFSMEGFATATLQQADALLATLALFMAQISFGINPKFHIRLPKVWREMYDDLKANLAERIRNEDFSTLKRLSESIASAVDKYNTDAHPQLLEETRLKPASNRNHEAHSELRGRRFDPALASQQWLERADRISFASMFHQRQKLPVFEHKHEILSTIEQSQFVIICADTGAGKSTQIPSYVLENELLQGRDIRILVTQPRRISAISIAKRVSEEIGEGKTAVGTNRSLVGYSVRLETKTTEATKLTFATTGVLLRMLESSPTLDMLDYLILDEVHERTMEMDLLFIALKRLREQRPDLKIILMSATVNAEKFAGYFDNAPILNIPGRTFPVTVNYLEDAVEETIDIKASNRTSDTEDATFSIESEDESPQTIHKDDLSRYSAKTRARLADFNEIQLDYELICNLATAIATKEHLQPYSKAILIFMPGIAEIRRLHNVIMSSQVFGVDWLVCLLHSSFSTEELEKAFIIPPAGQRKIVIATNIAETGITIPDVTAVIDTCKEKIMRFDERRQVSRLTEGFISQSSARQRRGRAARVREGICFHLVLRHRYENLMPEASTPEMLRLSLQEPILRLKMWNMGMAEETLSKAIDPPSNKNIRRALDKLRDVDALDTTERLTTLGKLLAKLPLDVAMAKLAIYGVLLGCLDPILTIVAMLSSKSPFIIDAAGRNGDPRLAFAESGSDLLTSLNAFQGWQKARASSQAQTFCRKHRLHQQQLQMIEDQRIQLMVYLSDVGFVKLDAEERSSLARARNTRLHKSTYEVPPRFSPNAAEAVLLSVIAVAFYPKILIREGKGYRQIYTNQQMKVGSGSVVRQLAKGPKWLCYYEAMQSKGGSMNALELSAVSEAVIVLLLGHAEFKFFSGILVVDGGRIRFAVKSWKQMAALQKLRSNLATVADRCFQSPWLSASPLDQRWFDLLAQTLCGQT